MCEICLESEIFDEVLQNYLLRTMYAYSKLLKALKGPLMELLQPEDQKGKEPGMKVRHQKNCQ